MTLVLLDHKTPQCENAGPRESTPWVLSGFNQEKLRKLKGSPPKAQMCPCKDGSDLKLLPSSLGAATSRNSLSFLSKLTRWAEFRTQL